MKTRLSKFLISVILAFVILNCLSFLYYRVPVHYSNDKGFTDYIWDSNSIYIRSDEGIGFGKTNSEGFMNIKDYDGNIDILLMGSSHMEAQNVPISKTTSSLMNEYLPELETYNIGISGHSYKVIVNNLDKALNNYKPKYVILEINNLLISDEYITNILNGDVEEKESNAEGIIGTLQRIPFFRLAYTQLSKLVEGNSFEIDEANIESVDFNLNEELTDKLMKYIKGIAEKYNTTVIMMYHPSEKINKDGEMIINTKDISKDYKKICKDNGIYFLDMTDRFLQEYEENYIVPHGFINTAIATGHLNENGHRMIADELVKLIKEIE